MGVARLPRQLQQGCRRTSARLGAFPASQAVMTDYKGMPALDAGLAASGQAVEHYEISAMAP
jgi:ferritin-like metal-binding protein YciE